jgi:protein required for attachment to host cells
MKRACVAIVDATRARLYTYEQNQEDPAHELRETTDLVNPARRQRASDLFSNSQGREDRREAHIESFDVQFARDVVVEIDRIVRAGQYEHVILVASPNMLGELRKVDDVLHREGMVLDEIPRDLAKLTSPQLHDHLAQLKLLPPRQRPGARSAAR